MTTGGWTVRAQIAALAVAAMSDALPGVWATITPRGFYDDFPTPQLQWIALDGPYNEHLVRDTGALFLALAIVLAVAACTQDQVLVRTAALAASIFAALHLAYHATHFSHFSDVNALLELSSLVITVAAPLLALTCSLRRVPTTAALGPPTGDGGVRVGDRDE